MLDASSELKPLSNNPKTWGPTAAIVMTVVSFLGASFLGSMLVGLYPSMRHWSEGRSQDWLVHSTTAQFAYVMLTQTLALGILWLFLHHRHATMALLGLKRPKLLDAGYTALGALAYVALYVVIVVFVVSNLVNIDLTQEQDLGFNNVVSHADLIMTFISLVLLPPIAEEIIFRGFLFGGLRAKLGFVGATIGTSLLFATPHLLESGNGKLLWVAGLDTFVVSLVLCYLREKTGRLWAGMGLHALKNSIAFVYLFILVGK
jgi:CAAX protease family protein